MKKVVRATSEFDDLIKVHRITIDVIFDSLDSLSAARKILPIKDKYGDYDPQAVQDFKDFTYDILSVFSYYDFEIIEEHQSPYSYSYYFSLVKKQDLENADYKYILFIRLSDHDNRKESAAARSKHYEELAQKLKKPVAKNHQRWKLREIVVNNEEFSTYESALDEVERRLADFK